MSTRPDIHIRISEAAMARGRYNAAAREGKAYKWLRENWPWYLRWAIGYPKAIRALDKLGLVTLPVFLERRDL